MADLEHMIPGIRCASYYDSVRKTLDASSCFFSSDQFVQAKQLVGIAIATLYELESELDAKADGRPVRKAS